MLLGVRIIKPKNGKGDIQVKLKTKMTIAKAAWAGLTALCEIGAIAKSVGSGGVSPVSSRQPC